MSQAALDLASSVRPPGDPTERWDPVPFFLDVFDGGPIWRNKFLSRGLCQGSLNGLR
jgi:hypothetical protein